MSLVLEISFVAIPFANWLKNGSKKEDWVMQVLP